MEPRAEAPADPGGPGESGAAPLGVKGIAGAAAVISAGNLLSRVLGLGREQLAAGLFGAGDQIAAFQIADNVHTLLFDLVMSGMLEAAMIPVLTVWALNTVGSRAELRRVSGALVTLALLIVGGLTLLGVIFAPAVVDAMTRLGGADGARADATTALAVTMVRIILPAVLFLAVGDVLMSVLYALDRPGPPALAAAARNAAIVVAMLLLSTRLGVRSMAVGVVVGGVAIVAVQLPALAQERALPRLNLEFGHPAVRTVFGLYLPIFLGLIVSTAMVVVDRNLAWRAEADALGAMRYATTLVQFVLGLVAAGISLASLPRLSRHFDEGDEAAFRATLGQALGFVTLLIFPAVFGLAALGRPTVDLLFRHGETGGSASRLIVIALLGYLPGHLFAAYDQVLIFAFYARKNTRTPVLVGVGSAVVYLAAAILLSREYGMIGLVIANSLQFAAHTVVMFLLGWRVFGLRSADLRRVVGRCGAAAALMAGAALLVWLVLRSVMPEPGSAGGGIASKSALLVVPATVGAIVYLAAISKLRVREFESLRAAVMGRFAGKFGC